tara:strand:- start:1330 stop:1815 length:486 start_codon:yes stop_codon:yes gene_type:complete
MPPRKKESTAGQHGDAVIDTLYALTQELRVLRDVLDEIREQISWGLRNDAFRATGSSVLKQMGRDPTADDCGKRLVIAGQEKSSKPDTANQSGELEVARNVIRDLLNTTELNLDEMEEGTRQVIRRAQQVTSATYESKPDAPTAESVTRSARPPAQRDRLF